jgi:Peptidase inhibitor I78 family
MKTSALRLAIAGFAALSLSGCVVNVGDSAPDRTEAVPPPPPANGGQMTCNAAPAQYHIGHSATQSIGEAILKDAGARTLRWGPPNAAWTMDYRQDRVNVQYNEQMKIEKITCG